MRHRLSICRVVLECVYSMMFSCACLSFALHIFAKEQVTPYHVACMCAACVLSYTAREFAPNNLIVFISHVLITAVIAFIPFSAFSRIFMCVCCMAIMLPKSLSYMRAGGNFDNTEDVTWPSILACFVFSLFGLADGSAAFSRAMYYIVICLLTLILIRIYLSCVCRYIDCTVQVDGLPIGEIVKTNTRLVAVIVILTLMLMLIFGAAGLETVLVPIANGFLKLVRLAAAAVIFLFTIFFSKLFGQGGSMQQQEPMDMTYEQLPQTAGTFATVITGILMTVILIVVFCFFVKLLKRFMTMLLMRRTYTDDIVENCRKGEAVVQKVKTADRRFFPITREERFRRMYMYEIERYDIALDRYKTCSDIEDEVNGSSQGDVHEINELYKSVRYGGRRVDRGTLRELNYLIKKNQPVRSMLYESDSGKRKKPEA